MVAFRCVAPPSSSLHAQAPEFEPTVVATGDTIEMGIDDDSMLRGHGTQLCQGELTASVCGVVDRIDKLLSVQPTHGRYKAQLGDVVVGRVTSIVPKRWKLDLAHRHEAVLQLSAIDLPGGAQRRRTMEDELNMRTVLAEGDVVSAEVQALFQDEAVALHTRSTKYGKVQGVQLVSVAARLMKRRKHQFVSLPAHHVDMVLGVNGYVLVRPCSTAQPAAATETGGEPAPPSSATETSTSPAERHTAVARAAAAVNVLSELSMLITVEAVGVIIAAADAKGVQTRNMLDVQFLELARKAF